MMNKVQILVSFVIAAFTLVAATSEESAEKADDETLSTDELMLLASLIADSPSGPNDLSDDSHIGKVKDKGYKHLFNKRQEMDYGWGGGWFGKRSANLRDFSKMKRYDPFNVGGRFGKRYDPFNVGGRFGKRYDPFNVGGRFGKRYDMYSVGGRFGKRGPSDDEKRYDMYSVGGRFGKRDGGNDKRYDMYSVGGRFGRDISHLKQQDQHSITNQ